MGKKKIEQTVLVGFGLGFCWRGVGLFLEDKEEVKRKLENYSPAFGRDFKELARRFFLKILPSSCGC